MQAAAKDMLKAWPYHEAAIEQYGLRVEEIMTQLTHITPTLSPTHGGASDADSALIAGIALKETAERKCREAIEYFQDITPAWNKLSEQERERLRACFIDNGDGKLYAPVTLMARHEHTSNSVMYRMVYAALDHLIELVWG